MASQYREKCVTFAQYVQAITEDHVRLFSRRLGNQQDNTMLIDGCIGGSKDTFHPGDRVHLRVTAFTMNKWTMTNDSPVV
jgi:hypothetical protein